MAILATVVARAAGSKRAKPEDFMPTFGKPRRQQSPQQMLSVFRAYKDAHNRASKRIRN